jgi:acyl-CoA synthetase (AMP-forming)/AMP-acid ligase II
MTYAGVGLQQWFAARCAADMSGQHIALCAPNGVAYVLLQLACWWRGACVVPLPTTSSHAVLRQLADHAAVAVVACSPELVPAFEGHGHRSVVKMDGYGTDGAETEGGRAALLRRATASSTVDLSLLMQIGREVAGPDLRATPFARTVEDESQPALMLLTSGSTGLPKGVIRSYAEMNAMLQGCASARAPTALSRTYAVAHNLAATLETR